jgi:uncharacterized protein (TIGR00369 family)
MPDEPRLHDPKSAFADALGMRVTRWEDGFVRLEAPIQGWYLNRSGVVHGGIASAMVDMACGFAGIYAPPGTPDRHALTLSLTVQFTGQASAGHLVAEGRVKSRGRRVYFTEATLWAVPTLATRAEDGEMLAFGSGTFRLRGGS